MTLARDVAGIGPEVVQTLDNPTSTPTGTVRFDSTQHPTGSLQTTNEFSSTIPRGQIVPTTRSSAHTGGETAIISYIPITGGPTVTGLLTASGTPHASKTVTSHSTVRNGGTSTSTLTSTANGTTAAGNGASRGQVQHVGVVNVMVLALIVAGVFGGMVVL